MKVLAYVVSVIVATGLITAAGFLIAVETPHEPAALMFLPLVAVIAFVYGPLIVGAMRAYWDTGASDDGRRYFRRLLVGVVVVDVLAAVVIIAWAVIVGAPAWIPILFIVVAALLLPAALLIGAAVRRTDRVREGEGRDASPTSAPIDTREIVRKVTIVGIAFVVTLAVGLVLVLALGDPGDGATHGVFAFSFAFIVGGIACIMVSLPLNRRLREFAGGDLGRIRRIAKVVLSRKSIPLDDADSRAAAKYASLVGVVLGFQLGYIALLYLALGLQQAVRIADGGDVISIALAVLLAAMLVYFVPYTIVRMRRARRYAREHAGPLAQDHSRVPAAESDHPEPDDAGHSAIDAPPSDRRA